MSDTVEDLLKAVRRFDRADTEYRRASYACEPERLNRAGTSYAVAKYRLIQIGRRMRRERTNRETFSDRRNDERQT